LPRGGGPPAVSISATIAAGLAPDGGLYVPETLPRLDASDFDSDGTLADTAATLLAPFFVGDALASELPAICAESLNIDTPLRALPQTNAHVLELFHGPTASSPPACAVCRVPTHGR
jgi:threonine synthase